jgi:hypothetical protein
MTTYNDLRSRGFPGVVLMDENGNVGASIDLGDLQLLAGTAIIGKVGIDQTTPGTTDSVTVSTAQGAGAAIGATSGAAVITDATGTIQQYLRGLVKLIAAKITVGFDQTTPGTTNGVAIAQIGATTVATGNGVVSAGVQRVAIASDSTGIVALPAAGTSIVGTKAAGTAAATSALGGGVYNTTVPAATDGQQVADQIDSTGSQYVNPEGRRATYSVENDTFTISATGVLIEIQGSASKTVRITRVSIDGVMTAAVDAEVLLIRRTAASTSGTPSTLTAAKHDSNNASATAVVKAFTSSPPTPGASAGVLRAMRAFLSTVSTQSRPAIFDFGTRNTQPIVLRGTSEFLTVYVSAASFSGGAFDVDIEWTEE